MPAALEPLVALFALRVASAADVFVTTTDDHSDQTGCTPADCTLREASVGRAAQDVIHVPTGTYQLASAPITLSNGTLQGAGAGSTIIKAAPNNRVLTFGTGTVATISGVTITGGNLPAGQGGGGGVFVPTAVAVTIVNSAVVGNVAPEGGGIFTQGRALTLVGTTVSGNTATAGGGITSAASGTDGAIRGEYRIAPASAGDARRARRITAPSSDWHCSSARPRSAPPCSPSTRPRSLRPDVQRRLNDRAREGACDIGAFEFIHPQLTVVTQVVNNDGGTQTPTDFNVHVRSGADVAGTHRVSVLAGHYTLNPALGALALNGDTLTGAGARATIIDGAQQTRVITAQMSDLGSVNPQKKKNRRLWGDGKGRFQTKGKHSAATVVGTKWLVEDRCTSTLTRVARGKVKVTDFVKHKTVLVKKGHKYVAQRALRRVLAATIACLCRRHGPARQRTSSEHGRRPGPPAIEHGHAGGGTLRDAFDALERPNSHDRAGRHATTSRKDPLAARRGHHRRRRRTGDGDRRRRYREGPLHRRQARTACPA